MPANDKRAKDLFTEELARIAKGGKGVLGIFNELDKRLGKIKSQSGNIVDKLEDQLDIGQQLAENQKDIFSHKINIKSLVQKMNKAESEAERKIYQQLLDKARVQMKTQKGASEALTKYQKMMSPIKKITSMIPGIGSTLTAGIEASEDAFKKGLSGQLDESQKKTTRLSAGFKVVGLAITTYIGKNLLSAMQSTGAGLMDILSRPEFILFGAESRAIAEEFGNLEETSMKLAGNMKLISFFTGVSAENQAKILGAMAATSDASLETLQSQMMSYKQAGVPFRAIMDDVANNMEFTAKFAKDGGANIFEAAQKAKELGLNLGDVASISNSLLNFESSIEKQMEAQVLLGRNINVDKARQLAFIGDNVGLMKEVTRLAGSEAEFNNMNYLQREALAGAIGISVERMSALVREESKANTEATSQFTKIAMIAGVLGATAGFLIGMIPGFGLKSIGKGLVGAVSGAGVGMIGASAGKAIGIPGLATGGIVNGPMLSMIGEKGPEVVAPIKAQGVEVDMRETNELLRALLGSSEKQVNRLSDIGTS